MILSKVIHNTDNRTALIRKNIVVSFFIKGLSAFVLFLLVPITLKCLGEYTNGVWLTISSMLLWIDQMDIGLGRGLQNKLASALAKDDYSEAKKVVSNTFFMLVLIIIPALIIINGLIFLLDVYSIFNVDSQIVPDLLPALVASVSMVSATFVFKFIGNLYMGLQLPAVSNLLLACGHILTLVLTYLAYYVGFRSLTAIALINTVSPLMVYLLAYPFTFSYRYSRLAPSLSCFDMSAAKSLLSVGVRFFLVQISGLVLFMTSNLIISNILGPKEVTPYQIVYRYLSLMLIAFTIVSTPYWSATTDAYERGDLLWIEKAKQRMTRILGLVLAILILMVVVSTYIYNVWVGSIIEIPLLLTVFEAVYFYVMICSLCYSNFLNGIGALSIQLVVSVTAAVLFIPLTLLSTTFLSHSIYGILMAMIAVNLPGMVLNRIQLDKILKGKAKGLWIK